MSNRVPPNFQPPPSNPPSISMLRLIVTALIIGVCIFGGTVIFSASRIGAKVFPDPLPGHILIGLSVLAIVSQAVVRRFYPPQPALGEVPNLKLYGTMTLIRIGMLEGVTILNYIFYLLSQNELTLAAGIVLVLTMLVLRPSDATYATWRNASTT
ncbi:hypothetical protein BH11PLA2_BH11PLA2_35600 [soil metagenome]